MKMSFFYLHKLETLLTMRKVDLVGMLEHINTVIYLAFPYTYETANTLLIIIIIIIIIIVIIVILIMMMIINILFDTSV